MTLSLLILRISVVSARVLWGSINVSILATKLSRKPSAVSRMSAYMRRLAIVSSRSSAPTHRGARAALSLSLLMKTFTVGFLISEFVKSKVESEN